MSKVDTAIVLIRHNASLGGDIRLARREIDHLMSAKGRAVSSRRELADMIGNSQIAQIPVLSPSKTVGLAYQGVPVRAVTKTIQRSAFAQEVFISAPQAALGLLKSKNAPSLFPDANIAIVPALNYVIESEGFMENTPGSDRIFNAEKLLMSPYYSPSSPTARRLRTAKKTNLSLSHDLHIFKAKFFPRMARALLNLHSDNRLNVLDPFCGSGTSLLEASLLGLNSKGYDIDPICGLMSNAKTLPFFLRKESEEALSRFEHSLLNGSAHGGFSLPSDLEKKIARLDRKNGTLHLQEIASESAKISAALNYAGGPRAANGLIATLASDAATKKIRHRFVGVGNGRYTINILSGSMMARLLKKIARCRQLFGVFAELNAESGINIGASAANEGDAYALKKQRADIILTSPPYLPASSGREHYATARALSAAILGMPINGDATPSLLAKDKDVAMSFPEAAKLLAYLESDADSCPDPQRDAMRFKYKAIPTCRYIADIARFFSCARTALPQNGVLLFVVAHHHMFYSHRRGVVEHVVRGRNLYSEIARFSGFDLDEEIKMELEKPAKTYARPMAKRDYFESILVFRPNGKMPNSCAQE